MDLQSWSEGCLGMIGNVHREYCLQVYTLPLSRSIRSARIKGGFVLSDLLDCLAQKGVSYLPFQLHTPPDDSPHAKWSQKDDTRRARATPRHVRDSCLHILWNLQPYDIGAKFCFSVQQETGPPRAARLLLRPSQNVATM